MSKYLPWKRLLALCACGSTLMAQDLPKLSTGAGALRSGQISQSLRRYLVNSGERLLAPGKETIVMTGSLVSTQSGAAEPIILRWAFPNTVVTSGAVSLQFNRDTDQLGSLTGKSSQLVQTLVKSSVESFFYTQADTNSATRTLERRSLRTPLDGVSKPQIVDVIRQTAFDGTGKLASISTVRVYYFDSASGLLLATEETVPLTGASSVVEYSDYIKIGTEQMPRQITRYEAGRFSLQIKDVAYTFEAKGR